MTEHVGHETLSSWYVPYQVPESEMENLNSPQAEDKDVVHCDLETDRRQTRRRSGRANSSPVTITSDTDDDDIVLSRLTRPRPVFSSRYQQLRNKYHAVRGAVVSASVKGLRLAGPSGSAASEVSS